MEKIRVFSTPEERAMGLQFSEPMPKDEIALFIEDHPKTVTFHNKNVDFDIVIKFFNDKGELIKVDHLPKYSSGLKQISCDNTKYILEKTAWYAKHIPKNALGKPTRTAIAFMAKKFKRFIDVLPEASLNQANAELIGLAAGINSAVSGARRLGQQAITTPDIGAVQVLSYATLPQQVAAFGMPVMGLTEAYIAGRVAIPKVFKSMRPIIKKSKSLGQKAKNSLRTDIDILPR
ncbi:MAG TPA: DUF192 domain-containing protein [Bacteroidales bacterium]|nr:DUF192 domain-containing protein [Bacteroidales bacterium]